MNTLVVIGYLGGYDVFMNVDREQAIERYAKKHDVTVEYVKNEYRITELEFTDEFEVYDIWV